MHIFRKQSAIPRFDRLPYHSSFPAEIKAPIAPSFGPKFPLAPLPDGRHSGPHGSVSICLRASAAAGFRHIETTVCLIVMLGFVSLSFVASAERAASNGSDTGYSVRASYIAEASRRFGVPELWIRAVMQLESAGDKAAVSPKGAMGLMQIMPETYAELRLRYHLGADPYQPRNNILAGAAYLREMHDRFGPDGFLAAYNAGPGRYEDYLKRSGPLPEETLNYVAALAPVIGVSGIPHHSDGASTVSQLTTSGGAHDDGMNSIAPSKSKLNSGISQFDNRQSVRTMTLFAIVQAVFEPTSASARTIDRTALEPPPARTLNATSTATETLRIRTSIAPRSSLAPSGDALFTGRSSHTSN